MRIINNNCNKEMEYILHKHTRTCTCTAHAYMYTCTCTAHAHILLLLVLIVCVHAYMHDWWYPLDATWDYVYKHAWQYKFLHTHTHSLSRSIYIPAIIDIKQNISNWKSTRINVKWCTIFWTKTSSWLWNERSWRRRLKTRRGLWLTGKTVN